jgi:AraC-like DNA-binding protein
MLDNRAFLRRTLRRLAPGPHRVAAWHDPEARQSKPWYGLGLLVSGCKRYRGPREGGLVEEELRVGDVAFTAPGARLETDSREAYRQLGLVFRRDLIRLLWFEHRAGTPPLAAPTRWLHLHRSLPESGWHLLQAIEAESRRADAGLAGALVATLLRLVLRELDLPERALADASVTTFRTVCAHLDEFHAQPIDRAGVAAALGLSPGYLSQLFRRHADCGFHQHLARLRLEHAARLARHGGLTNAQLAARCGGLHVAAFLRAFRRHHGVPPGAMRPR